MSLRIGVLYPCSGIRDGDFWRFAPPEASVHITRLPFDNLGTVRAVSKMSSLDNLRAAASLVAATNPHTVAWADTSGSFLFGPEGDLDQVRLLSEVTGAPATTTSTAIIAACRAIGVSEVDVASPYTEELNRPMVEFLEARGVRVGRLMALELEDSYAVCSVPEEEQRELIRSAAGEAPALLVPCTDFFTASLIEELEEELSRPIIGANPATMWHAVHLAGQYPAGFGGGLGRLFRSAAEVSR